jgi:hypothetical protein
MVDLEWESRSGEKIQIKAHANPVPGQPQYDLLVQGVSFSSLSHVSELGGYDDDASALTNDDPYKETSEHGSRHGSRHGSVPAEIKACDSIEEEEVAPEEESFDFRLLLAGLLPSDELEVVPGGVEDELTSQLNCSTLENLRFRVTASIPETEEMVSRAIINAFSDRDERDSSSSSESSASCAIHHQNAPQHEVDVIRETCEWMASHEGCAPHELEDERRTYMQKHFDSMFLYVRQQQLTTDAADRILLSIAIVLGIRIKSTVLRDTLILEDLDISLKVDKLIGGLCNYGEVKYAAIAADSGFGMCRFYTEAAVNRVMAASEAGSFSIGENKPTVSILTPLSSGRRPAMCRRAFSEPSPTLRKPIMSRQRSHQRNTMTIDTLIPELGSLLHILVMETESSLVTPDSSNSFLRPNVFDNIPASSRSSIYQTPSIDNVRGGHVVSPEHGRHSPTTLVEVSE